MYHIGDIGELSADARPMRRSSVGQVSVARRPTHDRRTTDTWPTLGWKCRPTVDRLSTDCRSNTTGSTTLDRQSTDSRPPVSQHKTNCKGPVSLALFCAIFDANSHTTLPRPTYEVFVVLDWHFFWIHDVSRESIHVVYGKGDFYAKSHQNLKVLLPIMTQKSFYENQ